MRPPFGKSAFALVTATSFIAAPVYASDPCNITSDTVRYYEKRETAILLLQYGDIVIRATGGKIRCAEDAANSRQICSVEGKGELLIEGGDRPPSIITLNTDDPGEVHIYDTADLSCGLASDF